MTKKSYAKLQRLRSRKAFLDSGESSGTPSELLSRADTAVGELSGSDQETLPLDTATAEASSKCTQLPTIKVPASARYAIAAAAFHQATTGATRQKLKTAACLAVIILVPGSSWIEPVRSFFFRRFGTHWQTIDLSTKSWEKAERNSDIGKYLASGVPIVGVAVARDALPPTLITAADLAIQLNQPNGGAIGRAIRLATRQWPPNEIDDGVATNLEFHDLVAAFRPGSSPREIITRLQRANGAVKAPETTDRLPPLVDAVEYGEARSWGLTLARDISDYRAGKIAWQDVDRGAVIHSEPGLGKTLFARILAQACGVPVLAYSISDLFANSRGDLDGVVKASRAMFERAAASAPCILFLDEIDALPNRATMSSRAQEWWTTVLTDFLLSLDNAVEGKRAGIVVIGATNNISGVDAAVLRPGRLERTIEVKRPDRAGALNILRYHLNGDLPHEDLSEIADLIEGQTGAEIMMTARNARRIARYEGRALNRNDLVRAISPVEEIAENMLTRICIHEAGHAVASLAVPYGTLKRCSAGSGGAVAGLTLIHKEEDDMPTKDSIERRSVALLCGRSAEKLLIGEASIGAGGDDESDLARVTQMLATLHASTGLGHTLIYVYSHRDALAAVSIDRELRKTVEQHLQVLQARADQLVRSHRDEILAVADRLKSQRQLSGEEVRRIVVSTQARRTAEINSVEV